MSRRSRALHPTGRRSERGAVIPIVALLLGVLMVSTAFAVDLGRQRADRRDMQAVADVTSLDMARLADGRTLDEIVAGGDGQPAAETALQESAARNDVDRAQLQLDWGIWDATTGFTSVLGQGTAVPNAAKIVAADSTDYFFQPGSGGVSRHAIATQGALTLGGFSVGSFGARLSPEEGKFLEETINPALGIDPAVLGSSETDNAGYEGLADADINVAELGAELGLLTPDEVLDTEFTLAELLTASVAVLRRDGHTVEADVLEQSITPDMSAIPMSLGNVLHAERGSEDSALEANIDAVGILRTGFFLSRCSTDATGFADCSGFDMPTIETTLPLSNTTGSITVVESERFHYGPVGTGIETGQFQVQMSTDVGAREVGQCEPTVENNLCVLNDLLVDWVDATVELDATVTLVGGPNTIAAIDCADPAALGLDILSTTDLYDVDLTMTVVFGRRGTLGGLLGTAIGDPMTVTGSLDPLSNSATVSFTVAPDVLGETMRSSGHGDPSLGTMTLTHNNPTVLNTLNDLGIPWTFDTVTTTLIDPVLAELDSQVLQPLSEQLGLNVVGADLVAEAIDCDRPAVQLVD